MRLLQYCVCCCRNPPTEVNTRWRLFVSSCVVPEQCSCSERSERAERSERSERVWPQIVRNIWPTLAKDQSKIGQNQPKTPKVNMLRSGDVSFDFGFEWCLGSASGYVAKLSMLILATYPSANSPSWPPWPGMFGTLFSTFVPSSQFWLNPRLG